MSAINPAKEALDCYQRARRAYDRINEAAYRGLEFKSFLANHPEALKAAEAIVDALRKAGVQGLDD